MSIYIQPVERQLLRPGDIRTTSFSRPLPHLLAPNDLTADEKSCRGSQCIQCKQISNILTPRELTTSSSNGTKFVSAFKRSHTECATEKPWVPAVDHPVTNATPPCQIIFLRPCDLVCSSSNHGESKPSVGSAPARRQTKLLRPRDIVSSAPSTFSLAISNVDENNVIIRPVHAGRHSAVERSLTIGIFPARQTRLLRPCDFKSTSPPSSLIYSSAISQPEHPSRLFSSVSSDIYHPMASGTTLYPSSEYSSRGDWNWIHESYSGIGSLFYSSSVTASISSIWASSSMCFSGSSGNHKNQTNLTSTRLLRSNYPSKPLSLNTSFLHRQLSSLSPPANIDCAVRNLSDLLPWDLSPSAGWHELGRGANGTVLLFRHAITREPVAVKVFTLPLNARLRDSIISQFKREAQFQKLLGKVPYFPAYYGWLKLDDTRIGLAMEFVGDEKSGRSKTLREVLETGRPTLTTERMLTVALDVVEGLREMHARGILMNDLKDDNILVRREFGKWRGVVIDLGHACTVLQPMRYHFSNGEKQQYLTSGRYGHIAPEVILHDQRATEFSDVFQVGTVLMTIGEKFNINELYHIGNLCRTNAPSYRPSLDDIANDIVACRNVC